jgi:hypothetical protein
MKNRKWRPITQLRVCYLLISALKAKDEGVRNCYFYLLLYIGVKFGLSS